LVRVDTIDDGELTGVDDELTGFDVELVGADVELVGADWYDGNWPVGDLIGTGDVDIQ
jgi:hypothetical protein